VAEVQIEDLHLPEELAGGDAVSSIVLAALRERSTRRPVSSPSNINTVTTTERDKQDNPQKAI
jgi:hypothetical protein